MFTVWAVVTATFVIFSVLPEDPARVVAGAQARPADVARIREQLALDRPVLVRYARYMADLVQFGAPEAGRGSRMPRWKLGPVRIDLGVSYLKRRPVTELLGKALPPTLLLGLFALLVEVGIGASAGVIAAARRHTPFDWGIVAATLVGISAPTFRVRALAAALLCARADAVSDRRLRYDLERAPAFGGLARRSRSDSSAPRTTRVWCATR